MRPQEAGAEIEVHGVRLVDEFAQPFITLTHGLPICVLRSDSPVLAIALFC